jgi:hypothetical protein
MSVRIGAMQDRLGKVREGVRSGCGAGANRHDAIMRSHPWSIRYMQLSHTGSYPGQS